jgi:hypothetical protein
MPLTTLFLLPVAPTASSPSQALLSHLALSYDCSPLPNTPTTSNLTYHAYQSTSSLLPANAASRQHTHVLTLPHDPSKTYVGSTSAAGLDQITIPTSSLDAFLQLLHAKLQPHWSPRQTQLVPECTSVLLSSPLGPIELRVGDLRSVASGASQKSANPASTLRGILLEITQPDVTSKEVGVKAGDEDKQVARALLESLVDGMGFKLDGLRSAARYTDATTNHGSQDEPKNMHMGSRWTLAEMYMELLLSRI